MKQVLLQNQQQSQDPTPQQAKLAAAVELLLMARQNVHPTVQQELSGTAGVFSDVLSGPDGTAHLQQLY
jgi:hypothetical protein